MLSAIPQVDVENRDAHKLQREKVEKEFEENQSKWYDKDGRVFPLQEVAPNHFVAIPKDEVQDAISEEEKERD